MSPIQSKKIQFAEIVSYAGGNANNIVVVGNGVDIGVAPILVTDIPNGAKISSIAISENFVATAGGAEGSYSYMFIKLRVGQVVGTEFGATLASNWSSIGASNARNQVIASFMGVVGSEDSGGFNHTRQIKIPPIYQRMREGDQFLIVFNSDIGGILATGFRYKFYQ